MFPIHVGEEYQECAPTGSPKPTHSSLSPLGIRRLPPHGVQGQLLLDKMMIPSLFAVPAHEKPKGLRGSCSLNFNETSLCPLVTACPLWDREQRLPILQGPESVRDVNHRIPK